MGKVLGFAAAGVLMLGVAAFATYGVDPGLFGKAEKSDGPCCSMQASLAAAEAEQSCTDSCCSEALVSSCSEAAGSCCGESMVAAGSCCSEGQTVASCCESDGGSCCEAETVVVTYETVEGEVITDAAVAALFGQEMLLADETLAEISE
ncbi:MAG: hypothetical protein AAF483_29010 [Planctomycetota bacterium]